MKTTMKTLAGPDTIRVMLEAFKDGVKACELNVTDMTPQEAEEVIWLQTWQGRTWEYQTISKYTFPDFDRGEGVER